MTARLPVLVHSTEMCDDNTAELPVRHRYAGPVDDFDQNVTLRNVIVSRGYRAGNGKKSKF